VLVLGEHVFTEVVAGGHQTCALTSSGIAYCWGDNAFGALGYGASGTEVVPGAVDGVHLFMTLSIGFMHACGLDLDGAAICWGLDQGGRLGQGTWLSHSFRPLRVVGDLAFTTIAAGAEHTCARASSGRIWCWGANVDGQLGDGTTEDRMVPNLVSGEIEFTQVAAGGWHTCGLAVGGSAYCWGQNGVGQLGDGTSALGLTRPLPTRVGGDVPFVTIAAGFIHACALDSAGQAYCWGGNEAGQLGDGTRIDRSSPVRVEGNHVFAELAPGDSHTCGRTTSNEVLCWGSNGQGQVGDGTRTGVACFPGYCRPLPTPVVAWTQS
jgi:alpha-tubulin suppressor-like RCC1 family protein